MDAATAPHELQPTLDRLRAAWAANPPMYRQRHDDLRRLRTALAGDIDAMDAAIREDFGHSSTHENLVSEVMIVLAEIDHALANLRRWMRPRRVEVGWRF
jgi:coniferyl-aldehyde dehydrogenase